ncbi:MAG: pitrilysin family protein [Myxococcota bacterium]
MTAIAAWLLLSGAPAAAGEFPYPVAQQTLDNGLRLYVVSMPSTGVVAYGTWMSVGSRDEVDLGRTGFAHFFEHLMFHGTPTVPAAARDREILRLGADDNAWTWLDETVYHAMLPSASLPRFVELESDRFAHLALTPEGVKREAGAVYGEYRKNSADPGSVLSVALGKAAFGAHTYGHDTIGLEADIAAMPTGHEAALAFFDRFYRPDHAAVLVVGDVDPASTFALLTAAYGGWARSSAPPPPVPVEPPQTAIRRVNVDWPTPATAQIAFGWKIPAFHATDPTAARLALAGDLLLASTGPLERRLVREEGLAYAVYGGPDETVDPGLFRITVEARSTADLPRIEAVIREELARLGQAVDPAVLDATRAHRRYAFLASLDDPLTVLHVLGDSLRRDPDPAALDAYRAAIASAAADEVAAAIRDTFVDARLTVATLTPPPEQTP